MTLVTTEPQTKPENGDTTFVLARRLPAAKNEGANRIIVQAEKFLPAIPRNVDQEQFLHALVTAANELEKECTSASIMISALNSCKIGLMPGKALGLAYFVPFFNKHALGRDKGANECQLITGYRGYIDLVHRNKFIKDIYTNVILEGEEAKEWADENGAHFKHEIPMDRVLEPNAVTHAYCIARLANGGKQVKVLNREQLDASYKDTPSWNDRLGYFEMCQKTAVRRAAKQWKLTPEMAYAIQLDEQHEMGQPQAPIDASVVVEEQPKEDALAAYGDESEAAESSSEFPPKVDPTHVAAPPRAMRDFEDFRLRCKEAAAPHMLPDEFPALFDMVKLKNKCTTKAEQERVVKAFAENRIDRESGKVTN